MVFCFFSQLSRQLIQCRLGGFHALSQPLDLLVALSLQSLEGAAKLRFDELAVGDLIDHVNETVVCTIRLV